MKINQRLTLCFSLLFCLLSISYASAQQLNISGVVISSEDNEPLIGATVSVKGNPTKGVITDINGQFQLSVETGTKMLVVSYVGMKTQEIRVPRKEKELKIVLIPETMDIDEVVVTGYGNFSKSSFTGSANTLRTDMLKEVPVMSVEQKLQGMTTGVQITSSSGQPGANQSIRIRGMGSFNASQEPLFVIDGVPVTSGSISSGDADAAYMNNSKTNIMSTLNPSDIGDCNQRCGSGFPVWFPRRQWRHIDHDQKRKYRKGTRGFERVRRLLSCGCRLPPYPQR